MSEQLPEERFFEKLSAVVEPVESVKSPAPSRLRARTYSALLRRQAVSGPLLSLSETKASGRELCVFEELVRIMPAGENLKTLNFCRVCHSRVLAERVEKAPIYWRNCPYVDFQNS